MDGDIYVVSSHTKTTNKCLLICYTMHFVQIHISSYVAIIHFMCVHYFLFVLSLSFASSHLQSQLLLSFQFVDNLPPQLFFARLSFTSVTLDRFGTHFTPSKVHALVLIYTHTSKCIVFQRIYTHNIDIYLCGKRLRMCSMPYISIHFRPFHLTNTLTILTHLLFLQIHYTDRMERMRVSHISYCIVSMYV